MVLRARVVLITRPFTKRDGKHWNLLIVEDDFTALWVNEDGNLEAVPRRNG
jgi:hypothetical protein